YGDSDLLLVRCDPNSDDYGSIFVVLPIDQRQDWYIVANTFQEFISKFYETQGDKFWEP
ncbi:SMI1/KNR4 family protein, partial [Enterobacteriaceae bacterium TzEc051]